MKIDLQTYSDVDVLSTTEDRELTLSKDSASIIFQMFSKNIYSNPIGSVVREITSNCFDSHIEAKVNAPVVIRKHKDTQTGTTYISFIDFGVGMSPDRINNIFSVYFESTKRANNEQIGGFGLGSKSVLAYKRSTGQGEGEYDNSYFIITNYNGVRYTYMVHEKKKCPAISLMDYQTTTEKNGTEVQIPVLEKDVETFAKEMVRQLYYFENIVFEGFEDTWQNTNLTNDYQIIRGKSFLFRGDKYSNYMHVCLGRVAYPIDYTVLNLSASDYSLPIALKLEVGDVNVTVSRENIDYSEATIKMLKKKLEDAKAEIIDLISKQYQNIVTLEQYFTVKHDFGKLLFSNGASLYVGSLIKQSDVDFSNFKYQFMKMPNDKQLFRFFFEAQMYGKKPKKSRYGSNDEFEGGYESLKKNSNLLYIEDEFNRKIVKQAYLKERFETYYIIKRRNIASNWVRSEIADLFNVHIDNVRDDKDEIVPFVKTLIEMQEEYMGLVRKYTHDYETLEVPDDFIASRKRGSGITPELRKITIPVKFMGGYSRDRVKLSALFDYNMPIFYGTQEDEHKLREAKRLFSILFDDSAIVIQCDYNDTLQTSRSGRRSDNKSKASIAFIQLAQNNVKYMEYCKKAKHVSEFFTTMLRRKEDMVIQYFQTYNLIEKYESISNFYRDGFINKVDDKWGKKVDAITAYIKSIPENGKNDNIGNEKSRLSSYFKLDDIKQTKKQLEIMKQIDEIKELEAKNYKTLNYFNLPYTAERMDTGLITLLNVAMSL